MWHLSHDRTTLLDKIEEGETVELVGFGANGPSSLRLAELGLELGPVWSVPWPHWAMSTWWIPQ